MAGFLRPSRCVALCLALAGVVILSVFPYLAAVNNPNENVRTYMTMALVEDGTLRIDRMVQRHGWINDMSTGTRSTGHCPAPPGSSQGRFG